MRSAKLHVLLCTLNCTRTVLSYFIFTIYHFNILFSNFLTLFRRSTYLRTKVFLFYGNQINFTHIIITRIIITRIYNNSAICIGSRHDPDDDNQSATNSYKNSSFRMHKCNTCRGIAVMNASEAALNVKLKLRLLVTVMN